jgi:hypothetical protein
MMSKRIILAFIAACAVGSCSPATVPPTQSPTATVPPAITSSPEASATPTITAYPSLQTQGPYLLFTRDNQNLTIMDQDGGGQKQIKLPNDGYIFQLNRSVSPDGKWLAYFTGSTAAPYDIALNLLNLSDETIQQISNLLAPGFPANVGPIIETMVLGDPPHYDEDCFENIECRRILVQRELTNSLLIFDWSADSQSIAFTAQINGPSSDIYLYNIQAKTIRQLTNELQNIYWLDWAPNGTKILYEISSTPGAGYEGRTLHITDLEGKTTFVNQEYLYNKRWGEIDWLNENLYLFYHPNDTDPPIYDLMILDTATGQLKEIWPDSADFFAINRETETILLIHKNHSHLKATVPEGIYMVYPSGKYWKINDVGIQFALMEGQKPYSIFAQDYNGQFYNIRDDGSIEMLPWKNNSLPWISQDGHFLLFGEPGKLALYSNSYEPIKSWQIEDDHFSLTWSPDSLGVFIFTSLNVYYLPIREEQPHLLENCPLENCEPARFVWLP